MSDEAKRTYRWLPLLLWALLIAGAVQVVIHARYRADLSAFLPRSPSAVQRMLVQQIASGPASRLILVGIDDSDATRRAQLSHQLAATLSSDPQFLVIANGEEASEQRTRVFAFQHRYLLSETVTPERFSVAGLHAAMTDSLALMGSPAGLLMRGLFQADPTGETLQVIEQLDNGNSPPRNQGVWSSADGLRALLVVQTRASGADTDAQARAIATVKAAFSRARAQLGTFDSSLPRLQLTGPGVFSVEARDTIKRQAVRLSLLSTTLIAALLLCAYRSVSLLVLGLVPVASGALAGVAAVALGSGVVEGVTLGFGITLIGESVDYPVYYLIQSHGTTAPGRQSATLWSTMRLGALTSICGFASLLPSRFPGLAQLGLYSVAGLAVAAAVTRWVLPILLPHSLSAPDLSPLGHWVRRGLSRCHLPLSAALGVALACLFVLFLARARLWSHDLAALSPVPTGELRLDTQLRSQLGAPDAGNVVMISAPTEQQALAIAEAAGAQLDGLVASGVIGGYGSPARLLPSQRTQIARLASLPDSSQLQSRLRLATEGLPVNADTFAPFVQQVETARENGAFTRASLQGSSITLALDAMLWQQDEQWQALLPLQLPRVAPATVDRGDSRIRAALAGVAPGQLVVLNLRAQSDALYDSYLSAALRMSAVGLALIVALLVLTLRSAVRVARVLAPLLLAVLIVASGFALAGVPLTILHLIGMLLIVAIGSNYALFFDRSTADPDRGAQPRMLASLLIANASTVLGFAVLASSSVPVLSALGRTVAPGTLLALWLAALLAPRGSFEPAYEH